MPLLVIARKNTNALFYTFIITCSGSGSLGGMARSQGSEIYNKLLGKGSDISYLTDVKQGRVVESDISTDVPLFINDNDTATATL